MCTIERSNMNYYNEIKKELIDTENRKIVIADPVLKAWIKRELNKM